MKVRGKIMGNTISNGPMLNSYPDSMGGNLDFISDLLCSEDMKGAFSSYYILPSLYHSDLDRGFSVIDYGINEEIASRNALEKIKSEGIGLKLDIILNHASVQSPQFQDLLKNGENSKYRDFFIDWNKFWEGHGKMNSEGYIEPDPELIKDMFFRKPGLPILMVDFPDGRSVPYWNTFYQEVWEEDGKKKYLGQMDLNINSSLVWDFYEDTLKTLASYGAKIVRLDAFAYAPKAVGRKNFLNEPETWDLLEKIKSIAEPLGLTLLPEIHDAYDAKIYEKVASKGYMTYDFFLPGLIIDALSRKDGSVLTKWAKEISEKKIKTVNMLGCHDGIPVLDLKGLLNDEQIQNLIKTIIDRGGMIKNLHGQKNVYYQVNSTYYSALGEEDDAMLLARAIQMFMPGKPQVWYLDLFNGKNDYEAVKRAGAGGHKEINRTNLIASEVEEKLKTDAVKKQIELLRFRNSCPAFGFDSDFSCSSDGGNIIMSWKNGASEATLRADLCTYKYDITVK
jgi:sucrose phosphorylase